MKLCPQCGGDPTFLGTLGRVVWMRCRQCGWDYPADDEDVFYVRGEVEGGDEDEF